MDGIFGIGVSELIIIIIVVLVIGGPKNALKWSRDAGRMVRRLRDMWAQMMSQIERELGDEGRELMQTTRELTRNVNDIRNTANPRRIMNEATRPLRETMREVDDMVKERPRTSPALPPREEAAQPSATPENQPAPANTNGRYSAWMTEDNDAHPE